MQEAIGVGEMVRGEFGERTLLVVLYVKGGALPIFRAGGLPVYRAHPSGARVHGCSGMLEFGPTYQHNNVP